MTAFDSVSSDSVWHHVTVVAVSRVSLRLPVALREALDAHRGDVPLNTALLRIIENAVLLNGNGATGEGLSERERGVLSAQADGPSARTGAVPPMAAIDRAGSAEPRVRSESPSVPAVPGMTTAAKLSAGGGRKGRDVTGAGAGLCVHRVRLDAFCKECS